MNYSIFTACFCILLQFLYKFLCKSAHQDLLTLKRIETTFGQQQQQQQEK